MVFLNGIRGFLKWITECAAYVNEDFKADLSFRLQLNDLHPAGLVAEYSFMVKELIQVSLSPASSPSITSQRQLPSSKAVRRRPQSLPLHFEHLR